MRKLAVAAVAGGMLLSLSVGAQERHDAKGILLQVDAMHHSVMVSCEAIPGYMDAMEMPFVVRDARVLRSLKPGTGISFVIDARGSKLYAEDIREGTTATYESEPMQAGQLTALNGMLNPAEKALAIGEHVPDFALTDQSGKTVHLDQLQGKVVALTFAYSRCPNPNYCFRLSNNLAKVERRFHARTGRDLVLITIMIDSEHDRGAVLTQFADVWKADPERWHFLAGPEPEIKQIAGMFGMNFWRVDGLFTHSLHTVIIDRNGVLVANLEGNQFTPKELGDLVGVVMDRH
jgi:protein SCO1/2